MAFNLLSRMQFLRQKPTASNVLSVPKYVYPTTGLLRTINTGVMFQLDEGVTPQWYLDIKFFPSFFYHHPVSSILLADFWRYI